MLRFFGQLPPLFGDVGDSVLQEYVFEHRNFCDGVFLWLHSCYSIIDFVK